MTKLAAGSLIVAPRMPAAPRVHKGDPFKSDGDIVIDCDDAAGCGWHWMGPRTDARKAYDQHKRLYHSDSIGVVLLNQARQ